jgi:Zn-dependent peptidase ImmA (M78 family)
MLLRQLLLEIENKHLLNKFVAYVLNYLNINTLPQRIVITDDKNFIKGHLSFGTYHMLNDRIMVYAGNRHIVDVMRTLAHELVHHKQRLSGEDPMDGRAGSDTENEANAVAGEIMRNFRNLYPEIYGDD